MVVFMLWVLFFIISLFSGGAALAGSFYSYYDPIYDSGVVEDALTPKGKDLEGFASSFKLHAAAATAVDYTDNARLSRTNQKSDFSDNTNIFLGSESDWDRHQLRFGLNGNIRRYRDTVSENQNGFNVFLDGRIDANENWSVDTNLDYANADEERGNPQETNANLSRLRNIKDTGAGLGLNFSGALFSISAHTTYNHILVEKLDGETAAFRNRDVSRTFARISYPLTNTLSLFVQPAFSHEIYAVSRDASGILRDSNAYEMLGGVTYNITHITALDFGIGEMRRVFEDPNLKNTNRLSADISLRWSPFDDFSLKNTLRRTTESTTRTGANDLVITSGHITPSYAIDHDSVISGTLGIDHYKFSGTIGSEDGYVSGLTLYHLWNESINTGIHYIYRRRISDAASRNFYNNTIELTLSAGL